MLRRLDTLPARLGVTCLAALIALQVLIMAAMLWPTDRPTLFRLISPQEAAAIAEALERSPPEARPAVLRALNTSRQIVRLEPALPEPPGHSNHVAARALRADFARYEPALDGRPYAIQTRPGRAWSSILKGRVGAPGSVRLVVGLRDGDTVSIERAPVVLQTMFSRGGLILLGATLIVVVAMAVGVWQVARPINRLSQAAARLSPDGAGSDLVPAGPAEVRRLTEQFNALRARIRQLVDGRTRELAAIAHDLRTYITRLRLRAEFIRDPGERAAAIGDLDEMSLLLDDTLLFARESRADARAAAPLDLSAAAAAFVAVREDAGQAVSFEAGPPPPPTPCDPTAFRRILSNLVDNALRYGGSARVRVGLSDGEAVVTVDDDGPGVPHASLERMTVAFERLEPSRNRDTGGAGLGLTIVKALVESQGGRLELQNRAQGGLRATVRLPARPSVP